MNISEQTNKKIFKENLMEDRKKYRPPFLSALLPPSPPSPPSIMSPRCRINSKRSIQHFSRFPNRWGKIRKSKWTMRPNEMPSSTEAWIFPFFFVLVSFSFWVSFVLTSVVVDDVVVVKEPFVPSAIFVIPFVSISVCEPLWTHLRRRCCIRPNRTDALLLRPSSTASALVNKCPTSISFIIIIFFFGLFGWFLFFSISIPTTPSISQLPLNFHYYYYYLILNSNNSFGCLLHSPLIHSSWEIVSIVYSFCATWLPIAFDGQTLSGNSACLPPSDQTRADSAAWFQTIVSTITTKKKKSFKWKDVWKTKKKTKNKRSNKTTKKNNNKMRKW